MKRTSRINHRSSPFLFACCSLALLVSAAPVQAQRVNDRDVEHQLENLHQDARSFRGPFESALKKSTIRRTSREKDAKRLAQQFDQQTGAALEEFRHHKQGAPSLNAAGATAQQINSVLYEVHVDGVVSSRWAKITEELRQAESALGVPASY